MKKFIASLVLSLSIFMSIVPTSDAYYSQNRRTQNIQNRNVYGNTPRVIYIYQSLPSQTYYTFSAYPGCNAPDIIVG